MTVLASSREDSLPLETSSLESREQSFRRRRIDITSMCHMLVHGVRFSRTGNELISGWLLILKMLAHRTLIARKLKGLEDIIPYTSVHWHMLEKGNSHLSSS